MNIFFTNIKNKLFNLLLLLQLNFFLILNYFQCEDFNDKQEKSVSIVSQFKENVFNLTPFQNFGMTKQIIIPFYSKEDKNLEDISDGYKDGYYSLKKGLETIKDYSNFNKYFNEQYDSIIPAEFNKELANIIRYDE